MNKLIKNEIFKIFKKKSIYILFTIIAIIVIINTIIGIAVYGGYVIDNSEKALEEQRNELSNKIVQLNNRKETDEYIEIKTQLDMVNLLKKYSLSSWQRQALGKYYGKITQMLKEINIYTYQVNNNEELEKVKKIYSDFLKPIEENNWRDFITHEIENLEIDIENFKNEANESKDEEFKISIGNQLEQYQLDLELLKMRLEQNISYEKSDRNTLLEEYKDSRQKLMAYDNKDALLDYKDKVEYNTVLANTKEIEYKIYHNIPTLKEDNARDMLNNSFEYYEILIILVIVIISGTIVSEEFSKGTIKLLLIKPHERWKILLSKFLAVIIITTILVLFIIILQSLVGGFIYNFKDYNIPIIQYNFNNQSVMELNVFSNILILLLAKIPMYILVLSITFAISTISGNTQISIIFGILAYLSKNMIYINENVKFFRYLLPANWDFTRYLYGNLPEVSFLKQDVICLLSFIVIVFATFTYFKNKDIKNT